MGALGSSFTSAFASPPKKGLTPTSGIGAIRDIFVGRAEPSTIQAKDELDSFAFLFPRLELEEQAESGGFAGGAGCVADKQRFKFSKEKVYLTYVESFSLFQ